MNIVNTLALDSNKKIRFDRVKLLWNYCLTSSHIV